MSDRLDEDDDHEPIVVRINDESWRRVSTLADADPDARVFTLDDATGVIAFGDGVHGRVPESGSTIYASYRVGSGATGNTSIGVRTTWPLTGGAYRILLGRQGTVQVESCIIAAEHWSGKKRPRFFSGRVLTADDLTQEQQYHISKHRSHLRTLHGSGIVDGLQVAVDDPGGDSVTITPGVAIDPYGREICLEEPVTLVVPSETPSPVLVIVEYAERMVDPVPVPTGDSTEASRIEDGCRVVYASAQCDSGVAVARLIRGPAGWRVDSAFLPLRPR